MIDGFGKWATWFPVANHLAHESTSALRKVPAALPSHSKDASLASKDYLLTPGFENTWVRGAGPGVLHFHESTLFCREGMKGGGALNIARFCFTPFVMRPRVIEANRRHAKRGKERQAGGLGRAGCVCRF